MQADYNAIDFGGYVLCVCNFAVAVAVADSQRDFNNFVLGQ